MCLVESLASGSVGLQQCLFLENTARRGGGLFMDSIASLILRAPQEGTFTEFIRYLHNLILISDWMLEETKPWLVELSI